MDIIQGTTPTFIFTLHDIDASSVSTAYFIIKQSGSAVIEKELSDGVVDSKRSRISFTLTQAESLTLSTKAKARVSLICVTSTGIRFESPVKEYTVIATAKEEEI